MDLRNIGLTMDALCALFVIPIEKIFLCLSKIGQGIANYQFRYSDFDFLQP